MACSLGGDTCTAVKPFGPKKRSHSRATSAQRHSNRCTNTPLAVSLSSRGRLATPATPLAPALPSVNPVPLAPGFVPEPPFEADPPRLVPVPPSEAARPALAPPVASPGLSPEAREQATESAQPSGKSQILVTLGTCLVAGRAESNER